MKLWLIVAYLLVAQQEYKRKQQKHGGHVVYVIETSFKNLVKPWCENTNFKKSKNLSYLFGF